MTDTPFTAAKAIIDKTGIELETLPDIIEQLHTNPTIDNIEHQLAYLTRQVKISTQLQTIKTEIEALNQKMSTTKQGTA